MKRWMTLLLCLSLLLSACGKVSDSQQVSQLQEATEQQLTEEQATQHQPPQEQPPKNKKQLMMIYMVGSDLESKAGLASLDIQEMLGGDIAYEDMQVYICAGGASYWWNSDIPNEGTEVFELTADGLVHAYSMQNKNMAQPETLTEFLDFGYDSCPSEYYSLILWDHGGGAIVGFGADENYGFDTLSLAEMDGAFRSSRLISAGDRFEWVGFDACLMGMIEVADMLSAYADYMVASEEIEAGTGWDYSCLAPISQAEQPEGKICTKMVVDTYRKDLEDRGFAIPDYTLSVLDLSKTGNVIGKLEKLVISAQSTLSSGGYSRIARFRDEAKSFGKLGSTGVYDTVDLYDLSEKMKGLYPQETADLQEALAEYVVHQATNLHGAHGVAVYFPYENKDSIEAWRKIYETAGFSQEYQKFIYSFCKTLSGQSLTQWDISEVVPEEDGTHSGVYYVQLSQNQCDNFARAKFSVWEEDAPGSYICWLNSLDAKLTDDGRLVSNFKGKRLFVGDTSGASLPCHASEIERNEEYVKYSIPVMVIPKGAAFTELFLAYIHVRVDAQHPEGQIIGVYRQMETDSTVFPNRDQLQISEGDYVMPYLFARQILFREDGSVGPFEQWESTSGTGDGFELNGSLNITIRETEQTTQYCCMFSVTDTQNNLYFTNPIYIMG